jgi:hypothetical protein
MKMFGDFFSSNQPLEIKDFDPCAHLFSSNFMIPLLHKSIKKILRFKSLGDLWVRERSFFLYFFLSFFAVLSRAKKKFNPFPPKISSSSSSSLSSAGMQLQKISQL